MISCHRFPVLPNTKHPQRSTMSLILMSTIGCLMSQPHHSLAKQSSPQNPKNLSHKTVVPLKKNTTSPTWKEKWDYHCFHLTQFKTLKATVVQKNPRGDVQQGVLYIRRPGHMRLVYQAPCLLDMMATDNRLTLYDGQRKHTQSMSLHKTPLSFLLSGRIEDQVSVQRVIHHAPYITWVVTWNKNPQSGSIHLTFKDVPIPQKSTKSSYTTPHWTLTGWTMIDAHGQTTAVQLNHIQINGPLPPETFKMVTY